MVKTKTFLKTYLLLTILSIGVFSSLILTELVNRGFCAGGIIIVNPGESIKEAVDNANEGDMIIVKAGTYFESRIVVNKTLTIVGEGVENTIIDGQGTADNIFQIIAKSVIVEKFMLHNTNPDPFSYSSAIQIYNSTEVIVKDVMITNVVIGVDIRSSNYTELMCDRINGTMWGIRLRDASCNSTIVSNIFEQNIAAIYFADSQSAYSRVYHNNFINNTNHVSSPYPPITYFDNGYPSGGNYWSGFSATDLKFGPYQNETGSDGILENPAHPWDKYPLANPLTNFDVSVEDKTFLVQVSTNVTVTMCSLNQTEKSLNLLTNGPIDSVGACRVAIPKELLSYENLSDWKVSIYYNENSELLPSLYSLPLEDAEKTYLFFRYNHTTANNRIKIIPEFSSIKVLTILLATITSAIITLKAIRPKKKKN